MSTMATSGAALGDADIERLRTALRGELIRSGHADYHTARAVWNGNIDRQPALIARCTGPADVQQAVNFARTQPAQGVRARRRPQRARLRHQRRRPRDRPLADEGHPRRPCRANGESPGRRPLARAGPRDPGVRPRHHRRHGVEHGHRRAHAGRRPRLADGQARAHRRQPALGGRRDGRRAVPHGQRRRRTPISSGRCGAAAATSASSPRSSTGSIPWPSRGRARDLSAGSGPRRAPLLPRLLSDAAG